MRKGIRSEMMWFANRCEKKLRRRMAGASVWREDSFKVLLGRLLDEAEELVLAVRHLRKVSEVGEVRDAYEGIIDESSDVGNFAMMIADKARQILG